jgi:hypothetical protein
MSSLRPDTFSGAGIFGRKTFHGAVTPLVDVQSRQMGLAGSAVVLPKYFGLLRTR